MAEYNVWVNDVVAECGCTKAMALSKIKATVREFCQESDAWLHTPPPIITRDGIDTYLIPRLSGAVIKSVMKLEDEESKIIYWPAASIDDDHRGYRFKHESAEKIQIFPMPRAGTRLSVQVSLKPKPDSDSIGDVLSDQWYDAILEGALHRLKSMSGREWTDVAMAKGIHEPNFRRYIDDAIYESVVGHTDAVLTVKHVAFGG